MAIHNTPEEKAEILDKLGFTIRPHLKGMMTAQRIRYAKEIYGMEFLLNSVKYPEPIEDLKEYTGQTRNHTCGHCNREVAGIIVSEISRTEWIACPGCRRGSVRNGNEVIPSPLLGDEVKGLPKLVEDAYSEARMSLSCECYTACELMCRKILMNVAVHKGAPANRQFKEYVDYLKDNRYIPITMEPAIKQVKDNGNESTHEIKAPDKERAKNTLDFTMLLLKNVYEIPERLKQPTLPRNNPDPLAALRRHI